MKRNPQPSYSLHVGPFLVRTVAVFTLGLSVGCSCAPRQSVGLVFDAALAPSSSDEWAKRDALVAKAKTDPDLHADLVEFAVGRVRAINNPQSQGGRLFRLLRDLEARSTLPLLEEYWARLDKRVYSQLKSDPRTQLLETMSALRDAPNRLRFLSQVLDDSREALQVRFRALILLARDCGEKGAQRVVDWIDDRQEKFGRTRRGAEPSQSPSIASDQDGDGLSHENEVTWFLDSHVGDTDGDNLLDGNDRNPLTKPASTYTEDHLIAQRLFLIYATFLADDGSSEIWPGHSGKAPFPQNSVLIVENVDSYDGEGNPSLLSGQELTGVDSVVLGMSEFQLREFRQRQGHSRHAPIVGLHRFSGEQYRLTGFGTIGSDARAYSLTQTFRRGIANSWRIVVRKVGGHWVPVRWTIGYLACG